MSAFPPGIFARGFNHPEGIAWEPGSGRLLCGGEGGELYAVDPADGSSEQVAATGGTLLGIAVDGAGDAWVCDSGRGELLRIEPASGAVEVAADGLTHPNFCAFDRVGTLWISDSGRWGADDGRLLALTAAGELRRVSDGAPGFANGLALAPDGRSLLVVESAAARVVRFSLDDAAVALGPPELVAALPGTVPDGLAFNAAGELLVSCYRPDAVLLLGDDGQQRTLAADPQGIVLAAATNLAFFGPDLERLAVANLQGRHLTEIAAPGPGLALPRP